MEYYNLSDKFESLGYQNQFMSCGCSTCMRSPSNSEIEIDNEDSMNTLSEKPSENHQLSYRDLILDNQILQNNIGNSETVEYSLYYGPWERTKTFNHRGHDIGAMRHTAAQSEFIASVFDRLNNLVDLDFKQVDSDQVGDIRIFRTYDNSSWDERFTNPDGFGGGTAYSQSEGIDLEWRDIYSNDDFYDIEKSTIIHEIGHALGLSHPGGVGDNPGWDEWDSVMSYNDRPGIKEEPIWFSSLDIQALQSIWGVEVNDNPMLTGNKAVLANGKEDTQYTFAKSALLQGFTDVDSPALSIASAQASDGTLNDNGNGTFSYIPPKDFHGTITLNYIVADGMGGSASSINVLSIDSVNDQPLLTSAKALLKNGKESKPYIIKKSALLQGFTDVDSTSLSVSSLSSSTGTIAKNGMDAFILNTPKDFKGKVILSYIVADGSGGSITASNRIYFDDMPDGIVRRGTNKKDKLKGSNYNDTLMGYGNSDKLIGKKGDDIIDAGFYGKKPDVVRGGSGSDTFVIKDGYWTNIKDFNITDDSLDLTGLSNGLSWDYQGGTTYIWGNNGYEVAQLSGYKNLDEANLM